MSFELQYVAPQDLHQWWSAVRPGLEDCLRHESDDAYPEDIYWLLKSNQATLHVGLEEGRYLGFVVLNQVLDPFSARARLNIWFLHHQIDGVNVLAEGLTQIEELADRINATEITFRADKEAFERWARPLGFRLREIELVKEV